MENFKRLALPCLIYALVFVLCLYENACSITMPVWVAGLLGLAVYVIRIDGRQIKKGSHFIIAVMLLIGLSSALTANAYIIFMNYTAEAVLIISLMLYNYADDGSWELDTYLGEIVAAVFKSIGRVFTPFRDGTDYLKHRSKAKNPRLRAILLGVVIAVPCLLILGGLLASADDVFRYAIDSVFSELFIPDTVLGITLMLLIGFFTAYCGLRYIGERAELVRVREHHRSEPVTALTVMILIAVMYLVFSGIQICYLFIGGFSLPEDVTYAEYARSGFFQLLCVCIINLAIVLTVKKRVVENKALNVVLLIISACTYIMIASSACRMVMYIREYRLTFLRLFVLVALLTLAVLLAGVAVRIVNAGFSFFRYGLAVVSVIYIIFAFSHCDYFIAEYNLAGQGEEKDYGYLSELSLDAAPAITSFLEERQISRSEWSEMEWYRNYMYANSYELDKTCSIRKFNLSAWYADRVLETLQ